MASVQNLINMENVSTALTEAIWVRMEFVNPSAPSAISMTKKQEHAKVVTEVIFCERGSAL